MVQRMNSEEMTTITIPYDDYSELINTKADYLSILRETNYLINTAKYDRYSDDLDFKYNIQEFMYRLAFSDYKRKLESLKRERESESEK